MSKFTVKTKLSNIKKEDGEFTYNEEIVSMKWDAKAQRNAVQSGKGPGEFGPDYSDRKKFHLDYHADWEHPTHDTMGRALHPKRQTNEEAIAMLDADGRHRSQWVYAPYDGRRTPYPSHVIEPYVTEEEDEQNSWKNKDE